MLVFAHVWGFFGSIISHSLEINFLNVLSYYIYLPTNAYREVEMAEIHSNQKPSEECKKRMLSSKTVSFEEDDEVREIHFFNF